MSLIDKLRWVAGKEAGSLTEQQKRATPEVFYRCKKCGYWTKSIGFLHGHMEGHTKWYSIADIEKFMEWTEKITVEEYRVEDIDSLEDEKL